MSIEMTPTAPELSSIYLRETSGRGSDSQAAIMQIQSVINNIAPITTQVRGFDVGQENLPPVNQTP